MAYRCWTDAEVDKLRALIAMGLKRRQILAHFPGMTAHRLAGKMTYLGLKSAKDPDPFSRSNRMKYGLIFGNLARDLSLESKRAVRDRALELGVTAAKAIDVMLRERMGT